MKVGIHIFRKDLRTNDNLALNQLADIVDVVVGLFIYDNKQIHRNTKNRYYYSERAAQFIIDSVHDLNTQCDNKLIATYGDVGTTIKELIEKVQPTAISFNADFTPYALKRDEEIRKLCEKKDIQLIVNEDDQCHTTMTDLLKKDGAPHMIFGSFYKNLVKQNIPKPTTKRIKWYKPVFSIDKLKWESVHTILKGGRTQGLVRLKKKITYHDNDHLINGSSQLSAYLNQGCLSVREVHHYFKQHYGPKSKLLQSIAWRDFFICIYRFAERGNQYCHIDARYDKLKWKKVNESEWKRFIKCDTGFVLIDAIMTEFLQTGFINNRARLLIGTFWTKYLLIDPYDLEYGVQSGFSRLLIDCNASQNANNHKWVIGDLDFAGRRFKMAKTHSLTGRMIRIDNEMIKRYDPEFEYIKKWLPVFQGKSVKECKKMVKDITPMYEWRERYMQYAKMFDKID